MDESSPMTLSRGLVSRCVITGLSCLSLQRLTENTIEDIVNRSVNHKNMNNHNDLNINNKYKVIFVCHGNICRSPMAEWIMKDLVSKNGCDKEFNISSAAVSTEEIGNDIYPPAKRKLTEKGISFSKHSSHKITLKEILDADYVVVMDQSNIRLISNIIQSQSKSKEEENLAFSKIKLLMSFCGTNRDVADPWYTGDFEKAFNDIFLGCSSLLKNI